MLESLKTHIYICIEGVHKWRDFHIIHIIHLDCSDHVFPWKMIYEWWVFIFFSSMVIHTFICGTQMTRLTPISGAPRNHAGDIPTFHLE